MFILLGLLVPILGIKGTICLGIFVAIGAYAYRSIKKRQSFWERKGIKYVKPRFLLGNMEIFRTQCIAERTKDIYNNFPEERYYGVYQFTLPTLVIKDPDLIKQITVKEFEQFVNHREFISADADPFWSKNLFASKDEKWRDLRSTLSPSFTSSKMRIMFNLIDECAQQFVQYFQKKNEDVIELEMKDTLTRYTNDVIATTAFGLHCNSLEDRKNEFYQMGKDATNFGGWRMLKFFLYGVSPTLTQLLRVKIIPPRIARFFSKIIENTIETRKANNIVRPDMIHLLMEAQKGRQHHEEDSKISEGFSSVDEFDLTKNRRKQEITIDDINSQAFIFFLAGFDTVSTHINFVFYELAVNPEVQQRLREELQSVSGKITYEALLGMKYLDMVVSETLRKWPPATLTDRVVTKGFTITPERPDEKPLDLEKGTICWLPIFALHRDPKFYPDPERFDPERFSDENKHKINPLVYMPFGAGPRNCIGSRFALLESKLILFHVLNNFEVVPIAKTNIPMILDKDQINLTAKGGQWLGLKKINKQK